MFARADNFQNLAGLRVVLNVRIARDETGRPRAHHWAAGLSNEGYHAILEDRDGTNFSGRVPSFGLSDFRDVSATISHVAPSGTVYLKNVRLRKAR